MMPLKLNTAVIAYGGIGPNLTENEFKSEPSFLYDRNLLDGKFFEVFGNAGRRAGSYIKLVSLGAVACLKKLPAELFSEYRTGLYLGSGLGNVIDNVKFSLSILNTQNSFPSPVTFVNSVNNSSLFYITRYLGASGPATVLSQENLSFEAALYSASLALEQGDIDLAIVGGADIFSGPPALHLSRMATPHASIDRLGEGSAFIVLASERVKNITPCGRLMGLSLGRSSAAPIDELLLQGVASSPDETQLALGLDHTDAEFAEVTKRLGFASAYNYRDYVGDYPTASAFAVCGFLDAAASNSQNNFLHINKSPHGIMGRFEISSIS